MESRSITEITLSENEARCEVILNADAPKARKEVFNLLSAFNIDIITQTLPGQDGDSKLFISIPQQDIEAVNSKLLSAGYECFIDADLAKISISGTGIKTNITVLYGIIFELSKNGIEILTVSTSEIKISILVKRYHAKTALSALEKLLK